jgi:hypothetical protein
LGSDRWWCLHNRNTWTNVNGVLKSRCRKAEAWEVVPRVNLACVHPKPLQGRLDRNQGSGPEYPQQLGRHRPGKLQ